MISLRNIILARYWIYNAHNLYYNVVCDDYTVDIFTFYALYKATLQRSTECKVIAKVYVEKSASLDRT